MKLYGSGSSGITHWETRNKYRKNKIAKEFHLLARVGIHSIPFAQPIGMHSISCTH